MYIKPHLRRCILFFLLKAPFYFFPFIRKYYKMKTWFRESGIVEQRIVLVVSSWIAIEILFKSQKLNSQKVKSATAIATPKWEWEAQFRNTIEGPPTAKLTFSPSLTTTFHNPFFSPVFWCVGSFLKAKPGIHSQASILFSLVLRAAMLRINYPHIQQQQRIYKRSSKAPWNILDWV